MQLAPGSGAPEENGYLETCLLGRPHLVGDNLRGAQLSPDPGAAVRCAVPVWTAPINASSVHAIANHHLNRR